MVVGRGREETRSACAAAVVGDGNKDEERERGEGEAVTVSVDRSGLRGGGMTTPVRRDAEVARSDNIPVREPSSRLVEHLKALINIRGPIPVATFMNEVLTNPV